MQTFFEVESIDFTFNRDLEVILSGRAENLENETIDILGFEVFEQGSDIRLRTIRAMELNVDGQFESFPIDDLDSELAYQFRAIAEKDERRVEGDLIEFSYADLFQLTLDTNVQVDNQQAIIQGSILGLEAQPVQFDEYGVIVNQSGVINYNQSEDFNEIGKLGLDVFFKDTINNLAFNQQHYAWAYLRKGERYIVSDRLSFPVKGGWNLIKRHPSFKVTNGIAVAIGEDIFFGLGDDDPKEGTPSSIFWKFNIGTELVKELALFPGVPRIGAIAFEINEIIYCGLGFFPGNREYFQDLWSYDPSTNTWEELKEDAFIGAPRSDAVVFVINDQAYVGTGRLDGGQLSKDFYRFDPLADSGFRWTKVDDLPGNSRENAIAMEVNNQGVVGLGVGAFGEGSRDFYQFTPTDDGGSWLRLPISFNGNGVESAIGFSIQNRAYIALGNQRTIVGNNIDQVSYSNELFELSGNRFLRRSSFIAPSRSNAVVTIVGQIAYVIGGENDESFSSTFVYDDLVRYTPAIE